MPRSCVTTIARSLFVTTLVLLAACGQQPPSVQPATLVVMNGKVVTVEPGQAEARAVAVAGDRIVAVGNEDEIKRYVGTGTQVIDAAGQLVIPGFVEGHGHFTGVGEAQLVLKLAPAQTWDEILSMVEAAAKAAKPGQWIYGRGWHQEKWKTPPSPNVEGFPTEASLSRVSPANPVMLTHASGHASFVNALAMKLSGVSRTTKNPEGGEILKDAIGNPTRAPSRDRFAPDQAGRRRAGADRRGAPSARAAGPRACREGSVVEGHHQFSGRGHFLRDNRSHEGDGR